MWGLGLACQCLVNNVLPLKLSSCMSHDAFDCVNKVQVVDCVLCVLQADLITCLLLTYLLELGFMPSFANLRPWFYPLKCEVLALALKTSGLGLDTVGLVNITAGRQRYSRGLLLETCRRHHSRCVQCAAPKRSYLTGLSGSALLRRDPRCLPFLVAVASTEFWQIQTITRTAASIVHQRSVILPSQWQLIYLSHCRIFPPRLSTRVPTDRSTSPRVFRTVAQLLGNLLLRKGAPKLPANKPRPTHRCVLETRGRKRPPAIFIPSAVCTVPSDQRPCRWVDPFTARGTEPTYLLRIALVLEVGDSRNYKTINCIRLLLF